MNRRGQVVHKKIAIPQVPQIEIGELVPDLSPLRIVRALGRARGIGDGIQGLPARLLPAPVDVAVAYRHPVLGAAKDRSGGTGLQLAQTLVVARLENRTAMTTGELAHLFLSILRARFRLPRTCV